MLGNRIGVGWEGEELTVEGNVLDPTIDLGFGREITFCEVDLWVYCSVLAKLNPRVDGERMSRIGL